MKLIPIGGLFSFEKGSLQSTKCVSGDFDFITASSEWKNHETYTHDCEALIIAVAASGSLGRTHYVNGKFITSDLCFILQQKSNELPVDLGFYKFVFENIQDDLVKRTATGSSKLAINKTNFGMYKIPYVEIELQKKYRKRFNDYRKIKKQLMENNEYEDQQLISLNQQILHDAISGKLTESWRNSQTLQKEDAIEAKQTLKYHNMLWNLPNNWELVRLDDVLVNIRYGTSKKCFEEQKNNSVAVLRIPNVSTGELDLTNLKYTHLSEEEHKKLDLLRGDLLVVRSNGSKDIVGKTTLIKEDMPSYSYAGYLIRLRLNTKVLPEYMHLAFQSKLIRDSIEKPLRTTVGINNINSTELKNLIFPIPPIEEQQEIIIKTEKLLQKINILENAMQKHNYQFEELEKAVIGEAFII